MSVTVLSSDWHVARKPHWCDACLGVIAPGDRYLRQRCIGDDPYTFKSHALCDAAYWHAYREMELWDDDSPDPFEDIRPRVAVAFSFAFWPVTAETGATT